MILLSPTRRCAPRLARRAERARAPRDAGSVSVRDAAAALRAIAAAPRRGRPCARAFTLVEMLVVVVIIGILGGLLMGAISNAREHAREGATRATIAKLNAIIMEKYESYKTRRVKLNIQRITGTPQPQYVRRALLDSRRDLMRMEMPERPIDIDTNPVTFTYERTTAPVMKFKVTIDRPASSVLLKARYDAKPPNGAYGTAAMLYAIVASDAEAMGAFKPDEIGDIDNDGWPEFHDGWGRPIQFLRWAPGFSSGNGFDGPSEIQTGDPVKDHDPFDPTNADPSAFRLVPLIYSAGPDGHYGLRISLASVDANPYGTSYIPAPPPPPAPFPQNQEPVGGPAKEDASGNYDYSNGQYYHYDNITNHTLGGR